MKLRNGRGGTPFRSSQARYLIEGLLRWLAPEMQNADGLRTVMRELVDDRELWTELELARPDLEVIGSASTPAPSPVIAAPVGRRKHKSPFTMGDVDGGPDTCDASDCWCRGSPA